MAVEALVGGGDGGVYNLGNGGGYSNLQVVRACAEAVGQEIEVSFGPRRPGDPATLVASAEAASGRFGWNPERPGIETIAGDAWRWHDSHPEGFHSQ